MFGFDLQPGTGFTDYSSMDKEKRLDRLNQVMRDNDLAKLKFEAMRSGSFSGSASEDRLKFNLDLLNAIKAKENKQEFGVGDLQSDALTNKTLIDANKAILKEFNETYLKINQSPNKQSNVNVINKVNPKQFDNRKEPEKIVGDGAEGGTLSMKFLSPLNEDLAMERNTSKSVLNVYM